uniref:hypothetical protein n=1 Tax=Ancyromonas sigmoides TaxID=85707 RepID=UPI0028D30B89|nr:hypothetical protein RU994_mgp39 [Ancyromonas sigmoides]WMQ52537.1 hypothetical protein [Ancyromonas sigmoides]
MNLLKHSRRNLCSQSSSRISARSKMYSTRDRRKHRCLFKKKRLLENTCTKQVSKNLFGYSSVLLNLSKHNTKLPNFLKMHCHELFIELQN